MRSLSLREGTLASHGFGLICLICWVQPGLENTLLRNIDPWPWINIRLIRQQSGFACPFISRSFCISVRSFLLASFLSSRSFLAVYDSVKKKKNWKRMIFSLSLSYIFIHLFRVLFFTFQDVVVESSIHFYVILHSVRLDTIGPACFISKCHFNCVLFLCSDDWT